MKFYDKKIETMSRSRMRALQLKRLKEIVEYAYNRVPFYRKKYDEAGVKPSDIKTLEDIRKLSLRTACRTAFRSRAHTRVERNER